MTNFSLALFLKVLLIKKGVYWPSKKSYLPSFTLYSYTIFRLINSWSFERYLNSNYFGFFYCLIKPTCVFFRPANKPTHVRTHEIRYLKLDKPRAYLPSFRVALLFLTLNMTMTTHKMLGSCSLDTWCLFILSSAVIKTLWSRTIKYDFSSKPTSWM